MCVLDLDFGGTKERQVETFLRVSSSFFCFFVSLMTFHLIS